MKHYIVNVFSGFEKKVKQAIEEAAKREAMEHLIGEILVPTEKVTEMRRGQRVQVERNFFPGYIIVEMDLTDESWHLVKDQPKVTGFLGTKNRPMPLPKGEVDRLMNQVTEGVERQHPTVTYEIGEQVRVIDGPFSSFSGYVQEVDDEKFRLKVEVMIFGRATPVELEFNQVEKT